MMKIAMSPAAAGFLRALLARGGIGRDRILLTEFRSTDWQSLTFTGERHEVRLRIPGPDADRLARQLTDGLEEAEFAVPGHPSRRRLEVEIALDFADVRVGFPDVA